MSDTTPTSAPQTALPIATPPPPGIGEAPPPRRPSRVWFWLSLLCFGLLLCSLALNLMLGVVAASHGSMGSMVSLKGFSSTLVDGSEEADEFIAVVPIQGMIMEAPSEDSEGKGTYTRVRKLLMELKKQTKCKGILLLIDSPGGGVTCSDVVYNEINKFKKASGLPVLALFQDVAASGGYYIAMSADHIMAHRTSITGSIGVISHFYNAADLMGKIGVKINTIKSLNSAGKESFKDMGSPYRPMRPEERELLQKLVTEMWDRFTQVVADGRKGKLTLAEVQKLADGRVFTAQQALNLKLIDSLGYPEDAYSKIREMAKSPQAKILRFSREKGWSDLFEARTQVPALDLANKVTGASQEPRFMYLWDGR